MNTWVLVPLVAFCANSVLWGALFFKRYRNAITTAYLMLSGVTGVFFLFAFMARGAFHIYEKERVSNDDLEKVENEYQDYTARAAALESGIAKLESDRGVEEEIRNKFRVTKDGEKMVVIVQPEGISTASPEIVEQDWWQRFLSFFGG